MSQNHAKQAEVSGRATYTFRAYSVPIKAQIGCAERETMATPERLITAILAAPPERHAAIIRAATAEPGRAKLCTRREAAEAVGVHPRTLARYVRRGLLRERRITPRTLRLDLAEVVRLFENGAAALAAEAGHV